MYALREDEGKKEGEHESGLSHAQRGGGREGGREEGGWLAAPLLMDFLFSTRVTGGGGGFHSRSG